MFLTIAKIDKILFEGEFQSVYLPASSGDMQVLPNHEPMITTLKKGQIKVVSRDGAKQEIDVEKGFVEINPKEVNIIL